MVDEAFGVGPDGAAVFENRSILTALYDIVFQSPNIANEADYYDGLCAEPGASVLDAGCGTGRIARNISRADRTVCAFDASTYFVDRFRQSILLDPPPGPVRVGQARFDGFRSDCRFQLAIVGYYSLSYVLDSEERARSIQNLAAHLEPGGTLVLHLPDPALLKRAMPEHERQAMTYQRQLAEAQEHGGPVPVSLRQEVLSFNHDARTGVTDVDLDFALYHGDRQVRHERNRMRYAAIEEVEVRRLAEAGGMAVARVDQGFDEAVTTERIYQLRRR